MHVEVVSGTNPGAWLGDLIRSDRLEDGNGQHDGRSVQRDVNGLRRHVVAILATDTMPTVELAVPNAIFGSPHPRMIAELGSVSEWYEVRPCISKLNDVERPHDAGKVAERDLDQLKDAQTIIVAASFNIPSDPPFAVQQALHSAGVHGRRIVAIGSGVFAVAAAGLLAGRRATTHWSFIEELRHRHPDVLAEGSVLYTADENIYTSAGGSATLDLCLELVRLDHGVAIANTVARWMVSPPHRAGGMPQLVTAPLAENDDGMASVLTWASERLDQPLELADLAQVAGVSSRTLARRFHAALGTTPLQWLLTQRIRRAQELLESTRLPIERIAALSGLGSPGNLRQHFTRAVGMSPLRYRREFQR
jgi:transcriptional regulator GlxA family with amidase domain